MSKKNQSCACHKTIPKVLTRERKRTSQKIEKAIMTRNREAADLLPPCFIVVRFFIVLQLFIRIAVLRLSIVGGKYLNLLFGNSECGKNRRQFGIFFQCFGQELDPAYGQLVHHLTGFIFGKVGHQTRLGL